ncbi:MarR family winged helix-turn-helix transcriptional regulator [Subtercola lobariae]|uniref:MarR family transcriptional regulator n=1 Tax=Subtercola lobariae TaxID=1588641 RepID=A0A917B7Y0_9MICO|nr:MarR family winged helix-turn-helix transcriptional regulator [Subtercola lobariae]GGF29097.1 MarR family transcriptional regulator [Subtercola lobariae]
MSDRIADERLPLAFAQQILRLQGRLAQSVAPTLSARGLTAAEFDVIAALWSVGSPHQLRPKQLTGKLLLTTGGLSNVLRRLDAAKLIVRLPDPADGRSHNVQLTPAGVELARAATTSATAALQRSLSDVPPATLAAALEQLQSIHQAIEAPTA